MKQWIYTQIKETNINTHEAVVTEVGLNKEEKLLIWTIKFAMRWITARNPELHPDLEKILGKNYFLYFDEKKNRLVKPNE